MKKAIISISLMMAGVCALAQGTIESGLASVAFPLSTISRNPSALVGVNAFEGDPGSAWMSYMSFAPNSQVSSGDFSGGVNIAVKNVTLGVECSYIGSPEYDIVDELGMDAGTFKPSETDLGLRFNCSITRNFGVRMRARFLDARYYEDVRVSNFCSDIGLEYKVGSFRALCGVNSLGGKVDGCGMPTSAMAAASYAMTSTGSPFSAEVCAQAEYYLYGSFRAAAMAQMQYKAIIARAGFNYGGADCLLPTYFTAGAGLNFGRIELDASAILGGELSGSMLIGLVYRFRQKNNDIQ